MREECRRYFDDCIIFDDQEYWKVTWSLTRRKEKCKTLTEYKQYCNLFIKEVNYGVDLRIIFTKKGLPSDSKEVRYLY